RMDPQDPERAELALLGAAVPVGEGQGPGDGLRGALVETPAAAPVALGLLEHLLPALASLRSTLGTGHGKSSLRLTWARGEASRTSPGAGLPRRGTPAPRCAGPGLGVGSTRALQGGHEHAYALLVGGGERRVFPKLALLLRRLRLELVLLPAPAPHELAGRRQPDPLGGAPLRLQLRHGLSGPVVCRTTAPDKCNPTEASKSVQA